MLTTPGARRSGARYLPSAAVAAALRSSFRSDGDGGGGIRVMAGPSGSRLMTLRRRSRRGRRNVARRRRKCNGGSSGARDRTRFPGGARAFLKISKGRHRNAVKLRTLLYTCSRVHNKGEGDFGR